jgi:hypothetical protein
MQFSLHAAVAGVEFVMALMLEYLLVLLSL